MSAFKGLIALSFSTLILLSSFTSKAEDEATTKAYISDDLFVYMLAGAGKKFRILGSLKAGSEIQLTGVTSNGYTQIINPKGNTVWIENQFINTKTSLRNVIAELNSQLAFSAESQLNEQTALTNAQNEVATLNSSNKQLQTDVDTLNKELTLIKSKLKSQDQEIFTQWFFNGAIVLGIGLLLGLLVPRLFSKKPKKSSWS